MLYDSPEPVVSIEKNFFLPNGLIEKKSTKIYSHEIVRIIKPVKFIKEKRHNDD